MPTKKKKNVLEMYPEVFEDERKRSTIPSIPTDTTHPCIIPPCGLKRRSLIALQPQSKVTSIEQKLQQRRSQIPSAPTAKAAQHQWLASSEIFAEAANRDKEIEDIEAKRTQIARNNHDERLSKLTSSGVTVVTSTNNDELEFQVKDTKVTKQNKMEIKNDEMNYQFLN